MSEPWGNYSVRDGEAIYDVTLDKNRQIGAATLVLAQRLEEYKESLISTSAANAIETIIEEFRHFVVGNTTASTKKFDSAYTFFQFNLQHRSPVVIQDLVNIAARIVSSIEDGKEYIDELLAALESLKLYKRENALLVLEEFSQKDDELLFTEA